MKKTHATRARVLRLLLTLPLEDTTAADIAARMRISGSTLRRRLQAEHTSYQALLDEVRRYRCQKVLAQQWVPGKCIAGELGFQQANSFYRAFNKWTGISYSQYKKGKRRCSVHTV